MRESRHRVLGLALLLIAPAAQADVYDKLAKKLVDPIASKKKERAAVLPFSYADGRSSPGGRIVSEALATAIAEQGGAVLVERSQIESAMKEISLSFTGMISSSTALQAGRVVGARYLVVGTLADDGEKKVEVNARLLRRVRRVRELGVRADYSYTVLDHNIIVADGRYKNSGRRGIHNAELLAKLYLEGDHALSASATYIEIASRDRGLFRALPTYWLSIGAVFSLIQNRLDVNANILITGALDDPNRVVDPSVTSTLPGVREAYNVDLAFDRVAPVALLQLGLRAKNLFGGHVELAGNCYNLLDQRFHYQDAFYELSPRLEQVSIPGEGISCFVHAGARY